MAITNELGMKLYSTRKMFADSFDTLEELKLAIAKIEMVSNQDANEINVEGKIQLEAECLSDGSIVYNVSINWPETWQG